MSCYIPTLVSENYLTYSCNPLTKGTFMSPTQEIRTSQYLQIIWGPHLKPWVLSEELMGLEKCVESILALELQCLHRKGGKGSKSASSSEWLHVSSFCYVGASVELCLWCPHLIFCAPLNLGSQSIWKYVWFMVLQIRKIPGVVLSLLLHNQVLRRASEGSR